MKTEKQHEVIKAAVCWWAQFIGKPCTEGLPGDRESFGSSMAMFSRNLINKESTEDRILFEKNLTEFLQEVKKSETLGTDYAPEYPLSHICRKSNCSGINFPQKAIMWIDFDKETVRVSPGYQKEVIQLYPVPATK